jgi:lactoylglutathione lyase
MEEWTMTNQVIPKVENSLKVLLVSDLEKSKNYYRDVLGCEVTDWWAIRDGLNGLGFKLLEAESKDDVRPNKAPKGSKYASDVYAYVANWEELDALFHELKSNGALVAYEPYIQDFGWGMWKEFAVNDVDGYTITFGAGSKQ